MDNHYKRLVRFISVSSLFSPGFELSLRHAAEGSSRIQVLAKLPPDRNDRAFRYVVVPVAGGRYIVVRWVEVEQIASVMKQDIQGLKLSLSSC